MASLYKDGTYIEVELKEGVHVGDIVPLKNICGVAQQNGTVGMTIVVAIDKTYYEVAKSDDVIEVGDTVYWDNTAKEATLTADSNTRLGVAISPKASGVTEVLFKLNG